MPQMQEPVTLSSYLWTRLHQIGIRSVHGLPGDYNLNLLDNISSAGLHWVGNCNELNAGYATDAYARVNGIGAMVTTGGVGELSAINPHAAAFSEQLSLVHIVGSPALRLRSQKRFNMHHYLGDGRFYVFSKMFSEISAAQVFLDDEISAPTQIDNTLQTCWISSRPVYIEIPSDMALKTVEGAGLMKPLDLSYPHNEKSLQKEAISKLKNLLKAAEQPCILVDLCAVRQRAQEELHSLLSKSGIPTFMTPLTQGYINESLPNFGGMYAGAGSHTGVQDFVESSDLVLHLGPLDTDVTTYLGSANVHPKPSTVRFYTTSIDIGGVVYAPLHLRETIIALEELDFTELSIRSFHREPLKSESVPENSSISQDWLWPYLSHWLQPGDIVLTDTGTASFGIFDTAFPPDTLLISISLWASIGYTLPGAQGAALAAKDGNKQRRTIAFQGDGSFQLTCQEISTMIKNKLDIIIFVICNNGYTIERAVHPTQEAYNDVVDWDYCAILPVFDRQGKYSRSYKVYKTGELKTLLEGDALSSFKGVKLVELYIPELDIPAPLKRLADAINTVSQRLE